MPTAENARLDYEAGQNAVPMSVLTDSGDRTRFNSTASLWSGRAGFTPDVRPNGVITGGAVTPGAASDTVSVAALTCYLAGTKESVAADGALALTRASTDTHIVNSITVDASGALAVVVGSESTSFQETRGGAGGPPYIPVDSIELAQVRLSSQTAAVVGAGEIFSVPGLHREPYDYPLVEEHPEGGYIKLSSALPAIHTGDLPKQVFASYAEPIFAEQPLAADFKPAEESVASSSTQVYGGTVGSNSKSLGSASFTVHLKDGVSDAVVKNQGAKLWYRFYPDRYRTAHLLQQGILGISRQFPAGDSISATCTLAVEGKAIEVDS